MEQVPLPDTLRSATLRDHAGEMGLDHAMVSALTTFQFEYTQAFIALINQEEPRPRVQAPQRGGTSTHDPFFLLFPLYDAPHPRLSSSSTKFISSVRNAALSLR